MRAWLSSAVEFFCIHSSGGAKELVGMPSGLEETEDALGGLGSMGARMSIIWQHHPENVKCQQL